MKFIELNRDNWKECVALHKKSDIYIASNLYSIAESQFYEKVYSRAITVKNQMVGYTMYGEYEENSDVFFIDRFMIVKQYRRKGYGSKAIKKLIQLGNELGYKRIETSTEFKNNPMKYLLEKNGFKTDHEIRDEEIVYYLQIQK